MKRWIAFIAALCLLAGALPASLAEDLEPAAMEAVEATVPEQALELSDVPAVEDPWTDGADFALEPQAASAAGEWRQIGGKWYYYKGSALYKGWLLDGGVWYYLGSDGAMVTGSRQIDGQWYFFSASGAMDANRWRQIDGVWYWFTASGARARGWKQISGKWYYFDANGRMTTGWQVIGGTTYFMTASGAMAEGWKQIDGTWYYFTPGSGGMAASRWRQIGGKWYYFDANGKMVTGWLTLSGKRYYFIPATGAMAEGWRQVDGAWRYFIPGNGAQANGWRQIDGKWYYFDFGNDGAMVTGWKSVGGKTYYFAASGAMVTGSQIIDGVRYTFSSTGALVGDGTTPASSVTDLAFLLDLSASERVQRLQSMGFQVRSSGSSYEATRSSVADRPTVYWESRICTIELWPSSSPGYCLSGIRANMSVDQARSALTANGWSFQERTFYENDDYDTVQDYVYTKSSGGHTYIFDVCTIDYQTIYMIGEGRM